MFHWDPQDSHTPTTITISETQQSPYEFVDVTCNDQVTGEVIIDAQTTLPVEVTVGLDEYVVAYFRNENDIRAARI